METLRSLVKETGAGAVFWNRRYEPAVTARDAKVKEALHSDGLEVDSFSGALLHEPWTIQNQSGKPFQVFTPFWRHCLTKPSPTEPLPAPRKLPTPVKWPKSLTLAALDLEPRINWAGGLSAAWQPGVAGAQSQLKRFLNDALLNYDEDRNRPDLLGTSRLSPHLHFGEITPRQIWHAVRRHAESKAIPEKTWRTSQFLTEIGWREFAHQLLYHFPHTPTQPLRADFARFPWREHPAWLQAWQRGATGYPIVDAGLHELWATGWMHNRVRMIVASFLVKDLRLAWLEGARWFWDTLVDADLASNTFGWQWAAGCGADAAPYVRVFNPALQQKKFDPAGDYVRRWIPEFGTAAYPPPIVEHDSARWRALEAYHRL